MGSALAPEMLTSSEAADPRSLTEARLRVIRTLQVSSAEIGDLLALKAASMASLQTVVFDADLAPYTQEQIAASLGGARSLRTVCFYGLNPVPELVESVLQLPLLHTLRFRDVMLTDSVPRVLARRLPILRSLRFLHFDNVCMSPRSMDQITACPMACQLIMVNMSAAMSRAV